MWAYAQRDGHPRKIGGALPSPADGQTSCKVWLISVERCRCNNEANKRTPLKFAGVPQTRQPVSAVSGPKFTILSGHAEEVLLLKSFFPIVDTCFSCEDIAQQICIILRPVFSASRVQHISDLHSKFPLRPHHVSKYGRHRICHR